MVVALPQCCRDLQVARAGSVDCANTLVELLAGQGKTPGEATELQNLQNDPRPGLVSYLKPIVIFISLPTIRKAEMDVDRLPMIALDAPEWSIGVSSAPSCG